MFTSCPSCQRQYRVSADQLAAAQGIVRCGYCGEKFSALQRLTDKPVKITITKEDENLPEETLLDDDYEPQFDIPEILEAEEEKQPASRMSRIIWSLLAFTLVLMLAAQLAWFNRDELLSRYPQLKPWAEKLCEKASCQLVRNKSTADIRLLSRDVRLHPGYADTLLVNATMANYSSKILPYPDIQFALFDTDGKIIAVREFSPLEYLDNSIDIRQGMPVQQPVHFVLEVTGPTRSAVSFEFRFL